MDSIIIDKVGHTEFHDTQKPQLNADEVLLDVHHVGLCGSDLNTFSGLNPLVELPRIPGHEIGGVITARGDDVAEDFGTGKSAIVIPYTTCGSCSSCRQGRFNACQFNKTLGVQQDGGLCEQIAIKADRLILNDTLPSKLMALVEPLSVGFHAVARGRVTSSDTVLVLGGGMIGIGAILGARAIGARVLVSEVSANKTETLKALGAEAIFNPQEQDLSAEIQKLTDGAGADVIIEAVGHPSTFRSAVDLAPFSGRVVYIGYAKSEVSYDTTVFNLKELDIMGSRNATRADFDAVIHYLEHNLQIGDHLISKTFPWDLADQAFDYWTNNREDVFKIIIELVEPEREKA